MLQMRGREEVRRGSEGTEAKGNQSTGKRRKTESDNNQVQLFTTIKGLRGTYLCQICLDDD